MIPVLVRVAKDQKDLDRVRVRSVQALSRIADKSIIPHLIDFLNTDLHGHAIRYLNFLLAEAWQQQQRSMSPSGRIPVGFAEFFGYKVEQTAAERQKVVKQLHTWWKQNQKNIVVDREKTIGEF